MKITLKNGKIFQIDKKDSPQLNGWNISVSTRNVQCKKMDKDGNIIFKTLHKLIMNTPDGFVVDHINGDTSDNRRKNLRICTPKENARNTRKPKRNKTGFKGVVFSGKSKKIFKAQIFVDRQCKHLGYFKTAEEAALVYNSNAKKYFGEFANLNIIK